MSDQGQDDSRSLDVTVCLDLMPQPGGQAEDLAPCNDLRPMSDRIMGKLPLEPMLDRTQEDSDKALLN